MKKSILFGILCLTSQVSMAAINPVYLQCPNFDERASDLIIVLNEANGTAALQSKLGGSGFNFSEPASFGPNEVVWSKKSGNFKHTYSVNRSSLTFERKTFSGMTGETYSTKTECKISKAKASNKF
ncbi:hypothetical protein [Erwinia aphidicola]|uniref:hypothetical protein n=1 Tax=Erwinia aphidicola TaxID=68334 RepID=UPI0020A03B62|nr:hypothetical protein [Erwinia aphidicola]MCP2232882.1 hypothetical protein [Erwinia aphidicola]